MSGITFFWSLGDEAPISALQKHLIPALLGSGQPCRRQRQPVQSLLASGTPSLSVLSVITAVTDVKAQTSK